MIYPNNNFNLIEGIMFSFFVSMNNFENKKPYLFIYINKLFDFLLVC